MRSLVLLAVGLIGLFLAGCSGSTPPSTANTQAPKADAGGAKTDAPTADAGPALSGKLVLTGSSTVAPVATELGKRFEKLHPEVRIDVQSGGTGRGITDARTGVANIGLASRALKDDEKDLTPHLIARDGVCVILHKDNAVKEVTDEQVVAIYTGKNTNWKDFGGKDAKITVVNKAEGRSTLELFCHYYKLKNPDIKADVVIGENEQAVKTVAGNPDAIGYVSIGTAIADEQQGVPIKLLPCKGVAASLENVKNKTFPLARELNYVTKGVPEGLAKAFIEFSQSKEANSTIKELFFVPINE